MAIEMTFEEYADKHSVFTVIERIDYNKKELAFLISGNHQALIKFWCNKRDLFLRRLKDRQLLCT